VTEGHIAGFERRRFRGERVDIDALVGGHGPPLLLLHGFPQTRVAWRDVAPVLAEHFTCVIPDLRGYGRSDKPESGNGGHLYSKRVMALDQIATMRSLGHERFAVVGHDRGARVAYRLALDHPNAISRIAVLDILPTAEMWATANASSAHKAYHWYMLSQPYPLPERLLGRDPIFFLEWTLKSWAAEGFEFAKANLEDYRVCFSDPASIHASCEDYRAGWTCDRNHDEADRNARRIEAPLLVIWGEQYGLAKADPVGTWRKWAERVEGQAVRGGHFQLEEAADQTAATLLNFLKR
jgi:haloacetate dehalogenase